MIYAVPLATVPVRPLRYVGLGALVLANIVAALPRPARVAHPGRARLAGGVTRSPPDL